MRCALVWAATGERVREKVIHKGDPQVLILTLFWMRRTGRPPLTASNLSGGSPREGARSQLVGGAATGGGGPAGLPRPGATAGESALFICIPSAQAIYEHRYEQQHADDDVDVVRTYRLDVEDVGDPGDY